MSKEILKIYGENILVGLPMTILQASLFSWLITGDNKYGFFALLTVTVGALNVVEKKVSKTLLSKKSALGKRPSGCGTSTGKDCVGCGGYPVVGRVSETWGMPSGHAHSMAFIATFWSLYMLKRTLSIKSPVDRVKKLKFVYFRIAVLWILTFLVCFQRVWSRCHTVLQVMSGVVIGVILGYLGHNISKKMSLI